MTLPTSRIVGGRPVSIEQFPYQVSIQYGASHYCGGSLISESHVLTAAQCTDGLNIGDLTVIAGTSTLHRGGERRRVIGVNQHPRYGERGQGDYDVSILTLRRPFVLGPLVQYISLAGPYSTPFPGTICYVAGWGTTRFDGPLSHQLQLVEVPIISPAECRGDYGPGSLTDTMLCAGHIGQDTCQGDVGNPLVCGSTQVGIASRATGCGLPRRPGIYTDVGRVFSEVSSAFVRRIVKA
ncbi:trypsin-7 isoform X2 [Folsomia candida]|uniref:Trypsin-7 n=1 Tax=Folsomia candida TaxID=158441 RepID=A0A226DSF6_FOLCA|nr:trypsin-7 isoform X2 [Folsomia candida]OXA47617.1 Trypsin-7 [Folsomia candida]